MSEKTVGIIGGPGEAPPGLGQEARRGTAVVATLVRGRGRVQYLPSLGIVVSVADGFLFRREADWSFVCITISLQNRGK